MKDIYLTSTFTNPWNVEFGPRLGRLLEQKEVSCYLPYRDTNQQGNENEIFDQDIEGMETSKVILAVSENESVNWGAEIGYAYKLGKPIVAIQNKGHNIPLICKNMISEIFSVSDLNNIEDYIEDLISKIKSLSNK